MQASAFFYEHIYAYMYITTFELSEVVALLITVVKGNRGRHLSEDLGGFYSCLLE